MNETNAPRPGSHGSDRFEGLLRLLDPDRDRAGEKYERLRRRLIKFFEWNSCFPAEDLADTTFERLARKIEEVQIRDVAGLAWGIAKNLRQEARREAGRTIHLQDLPGSEDDLPGTLNQEQAIHEKMQEERRFQCLKLCLQRLAESDREVFLAYHNVSGEQLHYRQRLAKRLGLTLGTLRVRVNRARDELEKCVRKCFSSWRIRARTST
jgi:RNA polymerase sigma factor (sigma-70 family)